jgi:hypothetical protein
MPFVGQDPIVYGTGNVGWYHSIPPAAYSKGFDYKETFRGSGNPFAAESPFNRGLIFIHGEKKALNGRAILLALFCPWLLFCFVYLVFGFWLRYAYPMVADALVLVAFLVGVGPCLYWSLRAIKGKMFDQQYVPTWWIFLLITSLVAFFLGMEQGAVCYTSYMKPYYDLKNLEGYSGIDTNDYLGMQLQDAGSISFSSGTTLDLQHSMGFKSKDIFCVSPIKSPVDQNVPTSIDFWAVGKNCCSGTQADFHCPGFSDPHASGALRLMSEEDRPFYRLAVQQAEATYKMTASHPLFFEWVHNADESMDNFFKTGWSHFVMYAVIYFLGQGFFVACATIAFAKLIHA